MQLHKHITDVLVLLRRQFIYWQYLWKNVGWNWP